MVERIKWIDICKGIGIILMMVGHYAYTPSWLKDIIYSFHMPLFFILSGYLANVRITAKSKSFFNYIVAKNRSLFVPYIFWALLMGGVGVIMHIPPGETWGNVIIQTFVWNNPSAKPLWFLFSLFVTDICFYPFKGLDEKWKVILSFVFFSCGIICLYYVIRLPLRLDVVFWGIGYNLIGGGLVGKTIKKVHELRMQRFVMFLWGGYILLALLLPHYDMYCGVGKFYSFIIAILGSLLLIVTIESYESLLFHWFCQLTNWMALNSIVILAFHSKLLWVVDKLSNNIPVINCIIMNVIVTVIIETFFLYVVSKICNKYIYMLVGKKARS